MPVTYKVTASGSKSPEVHTACLVCGADLKTPLSDAGSVQQCPICRSDFKVPGQSELEEHRRARKAEDDRLAEERSRAQDIQRQWKQAQAKEKAKVVVSSARESAKAGMSEPGPGVAGAVALLMIVMGVVGLFWGFTMETSVLTLGGGLVENIGALNARTNYFIFGSVFVAGGMCTSAIASAISAIGYWGRVNARRDDRPKPE